MENYSTKYMCIVGSSPEVKPNLIQSQYHAGTDLPRRQAFRDQRMDASILCGKVWDKTSNRVHVHDLTLQVGLQSGERENIVHHSDSTCSTDEAAHP